MGLRILQAVSPSLGNPWLSAHAATTAWLAAALRERGHEVTVRVSPTPAREASPAASAGFDIVHVHDSQDALPPAFPPRDGVVVTSYTAAIRPGGAPWIALSASHERLAGMCATAILPPPVDTDAVPVAREAGDHLAFAFDGHDDYALGAAISVAAHAERPLDVVMSASVVPGEACLRRLADAEATGHVRVHRLAVNDFPAAIADAAAYLAFNRGPFDMGALTAMAAGTPVVTFAGMPAAGVIVGGESGYVCEAPADAGRVLERLDLLSPALARSRASVVFDAAASAAHHEALYRQLLEGELLFDRDPERPRVAAQRDVVGSREAVAAA